MGDISLHSLSTNYKRYIEELFGTTGVSILILIYKNTPTMLSINQSNFSSANIPGKARLSGATAKSVINSKIEETVP